MSIPTTIKALKSQPGEGLAIEEVALSTNLAPYEVLVKTRAVGLNPTDWKHSIGGIWGEAGFVVGCDGAGDVVAVGSDVKHVQIGDRVAAFLYGTQDETNGAFAEYARYNSSSAWKLPEGMSYAEAASFPIPILTALQNLYFRHDLPYPSTVKSGTRPTENILIWGGSTAVGHHAIQLAHLSGQRVIAIASARNHEFLKSIGADVTIDYKNEDVVKQIRDSLGGLPLRRALDTVCEQGSTYNVIDAIDAEGGYVTLTLPADAATSARRAEVKLEFALAYTLVTRAPITFGKVVPVPFIPEDNARALAWNATEQGALVEGWVEGRGSTRGYRTQKLRVGEGLEGVMEGLNIMKRGEYAAEKLVYNI
ncbi:GroES-like protein [Athelia psychrophila]|uniref:GroES-like protein n=1 Tax=Athelia psychrophila TaxID=1759441 RepID=A0A165XSV5_9AGAM|nr:GroES-like protein [Fibularhizoctonia sp. CBS 109695]